MLMDNMAYLQQIAGTNNTLDTNAKKDGFFSKIFNIWTLLIGGGLFILLMIALVVVGAMNKVDTKDQDLMQQSYFMASYMTENTFSEYNEDIKNSDIRNMSASFKAILQEIILKDKEFLMDRHEIDVDDLEEEPVATDEKDKIEELNETLKLGRLNGVFDRTWLREMTMQIAIIRSYQSEIAARTKDEEIKDFSERIESNLTNVYNQFHDFKGLGI